PKTTIAIKRLSVSRDVCPQRPYSQPRPCTGPLCASARRQYRHYVCDCADPDAGFRRRGRRFQPRQFDQASMQAALDATALMVSKNASSLTSAQVQTAAQAYFLAMFTRPEATNIKITASYSSSGGSNVLVTGSTDMTTYFMAILG